MEKFFDKSTAPANLTEYNGILFWQDRRNSTVKYNPDGSYNCAGPSFTTGCIKSSGELAADHVLQLSPRIAIDASMNFVGMNGVMYQPRGGWMKFQGSGSLSGALKVITGGIQMGGGPDITLNGPTLDLLKFVAVLIE